MNNNRENEFKLKIPDLPKKDFGISYVKTNMKKESRSIKLQGEIGKGGYGTVFKCVDNMGNLMAVKCMDVGKGGIPCLMETSIMSIIQHPYINTAIEIYPTNNKLYIIQDIAESDLQDWRQKNVPTEEQIKKWSYHLIQAIACLHKQDIIHGDIKASNLLLYKTDTIKLSDFTLSTKVGWNNSYEVCTCTHRPLEVWLNRSWDKSVDIWALGCTLFEIVYGHTLFPDQIRRSTKIKQSETEEYVKTTFDSKFINAILDWTYKGPINQSNNISYRDTPYLTFNLPNSFRLDKDINRLIVSMLQTDPLKRPTAEQLLEDTYFNGWTGTKYSFINTPCSNITSTVSSRIDAKIYKYIKNNHLRCTISQMVKQLYSKITGLVNMSDSVKLIACIWIVYKLVNRIHINVENVEIDQSIIIDTESQICKYLSFRLYDCVHQ